MKVVIHDRTEDLPPSLREYAERKLARLSRHYDRVVEAEVHFEEERLRSQKRVHVSRIIVHLDGRNSPVLKAEERAVDPQFALDLALDDLDRQVVKLKEKVKVRKSPASSPQPARTAAAGRNGAEVERRQAFLRPESLEHARAVLEADGDLFHVFLNESSGEVNVIYRRADGGLAVIEPVIP